MPEASRCQHARTRVLRASSGTSWDYGCPYTLLACQECGLEFYDRDWRQPHTRIEVTYRSNGDAVRTETRFDHHGNEIS
jgi:hypothetical protein